MIHKKKDLVMSQRRYDFSAILCLVGLLMLSLGACGDKKNQEDAESAAAAQKQAKGEDPIRDLLDVVNKEKIQPTKPAALSTLTKDLDFSDMEIGQLLTLPAVLSNDGDDPLIIKNIEVTGDPESFKIAGDCTIETSLTAEKRSCRMEISFRPMEQRTYNAGVVVTHSGKDNPLILNLTGSGKLLPPLPEPQAMDIPEPEMQAPSMGYANAQQVLSQRRASGLKNLQLLPTPDGTWRNKDKNYAGIGDEPVTSTYPVDRSRMITADRYIPAVLENHISTDIPSGRITAVIEQNVFGADGRNVLIPGGSRAVGIYQFGGGGGSAGRQGAGSNGGGSNSPTGSRAEVVWTRIIRPDGAAIKVGNQSADVMGRRGLSGDLDRRLFERYGEPLLLSMLATATTLAFTDDNSEVSSFTGLNFGGTLGTFSTEEVSKGEVAARAFTSSLLEIARDLVINNADLRPILRIPAGTRFVIMPTSDIVMRDPQKLEPITGGGDLISKAKGLIQALQTGDREAAALGLAEVLAASAQAGQANEAAGGFGGTMPGQDSGQFSFGPPPGGEQSQIAPVPGGAAP
jgi:type IV secretory pathway VirB10-like protein